MRGQHGGLSKNMLGLEGWVKDIRLHDVGLTSASRRRAEHSKHQEYQLPCALCRRCAFDRAPPSGTVSGGSTCAAGAGPMIL